jgi:pimeloyl-ACP methyl ester carboxylesterase
MSSSLAWAGSGNSFIDHLPKLAERFRAITPDTRGSGATVHPGGSVKFHVLVADLIALVDALELDRPAVGGFSEGGATATVAAIDHPDRFRALINHGGFDYFFQRPDTMSEFRSAFGGHGEATEADPDHVERRFRGDYQMADFFDRLQRDYDTSQGEGYWRRYISQLFERTVTGVALTKEDLSRIVTPTLVMAGDRDFFCSPEMTAEINRAIPASEMSIVPGTKHEINLGVVENMSAFLQRL